VDFGAYAADRREPEPQLINEDIEDIERPENKLRRRTQLGPELVLLIMFTISMPAKFLVT